MQKIYDFIVVGCGPAGSMFCAKLDSKFTALRIDGRVKHGKPCGGLLAPQSLYFLGKNRMSVPKEILVDPQIHIVRTIDLDSKQERDYFRNYLNIDREKFDRWLMSYAGSNIDTIEGHAVDISYSNSVYSVRVHTGEGYETYYAKKLVGADGAGGMVRNHMFPERKIGKYISIQEWYENSSEPTFACIFHRPSSPSCSWIVTKNDRISFGGAFEIEGGKDAFEIQKKILIDSFGFNFSSPLYREACLVNNVKRAKDFCLGNDTCFLIGEAAGFISPSSFEGISLAMKTGSYLAAAAASSDMLKSYIKATKALRKDVLKKRFKKPFMYNPVLRGLVFRSNIQAVKMNNK